MNLDKSRQAMIHKSLTPLALKRVTELEHELAILRAIFQTTAPNGILTVPQNGAAHKPIVKRKKMSAARRALISKRMRAYWASR